VLLICREFVRVIKERRTDFSEALFLLLTSSRMKAASHLLNVICFLGCARLQAGESVRLLVGDEQQLQQKEAYGTPFSCKASRCV
jgi:hypothetical protein